MANNYKWYLEHDLDEYAGKWVAIADEKVIAANEDPDELVKEVQKKYKISDIFLTHIPGKGVALVYACLSVS